HPAPREISTGAPSSRLAGETDEVLHSGMSPGVVGQRCMSEREPELGLGVVASVDQASRRIAIEFPATRERRLYALGTAVLKRVQFRAGENVTTRDGVTLAIDTVEEEGGLLVYV